MVAAAVAGIGTSLLVGWWRNPNRLENRLDKETATSTTAKEWGVEKI